MLHFFKLIIDSGNSKNKKAPPFFSGAFFLSQMQRIYFQIKI